MELVKGNRTAGYVFVFSIILIVPVIMAVFAYKKFGYLTTLPSNAGTGMRASYMLHLPTLAGNDKISGLIPEVGR